MSFAAASYSIAQYQAARVATVSPVQIVVSLYQGAIRFLREAVRKQEEKDLGGRGHALSRAHAIVCELQVTLDHERAPEMSAQLDRLYDFVLHRISMATLENDANHVLPAVPILETLLSAWLEIARRTP